ncbi:TRIC cation channel family protein [Nocardia sp. NPDC023988]|uniref:trimeric intracellular cation channel family protein n=1 Tax=unclassified Nocardia TaxID=2637762 RepID=UPI0033C66A21
MVTQFDELFRVLDLCGVFVNAALGGVLARSQRFDFVGFVVIALASGLGGGMLRDTLLQHGTPVGLTDYAYILTALAGAVSAFMLGFTGRYWHRFYLLMDAAALGLWATTGAQKTLAAGLGWLPALLLGTITAIGGGMIRDLLLLRTPRVFGGNTLYATSAVAASAVLVVLVYAGFSALGAVLAPVVGAGLCLVASWRGWMLPQAAPKDS